MLHSWSLYRKDLVRQYFLTVIWNTQKPRCLIFYNVSAQKFDLIQFVNEQMLKRYVHSEWTRGGGDDVEMKTKE